MKTFFVGLFAAILGVVLGVLVSSFDWVQDRLPDKLKIQHKTIREDFKQITDKRIVEDLLGRKFLVSGKEWKVSKNIRVAERIGSYPHSGNRVVVVVQVEDVVLGDLYLGLIRLNYDAVLNTKGSLVYFTESCDNLFVKMISLRTDKFDLPPIRPLKD